MSELETRTFTPTENIVEPFVDGSGWKVVAEAGKPVPWARAQMLGLIDADGKATVKGKIDKGEPIEVARGDTEIVTAKIPPPIPREK